VRQGTDKQEGVLYAYGILETGQQGLRHLALGNHESDDAWLSFLHDVTARGLKAPLLVISDGQPGLHKALREVFPQAFLPSAVPGPQASWPSCRRPRGPC
jgi:transposase-like protein